VKIIVNDTNILIDLADIDLLEDAVKLNFEFQTNDFIISEISSPTQLAKVQLLADSGKLTVLTTQAEEYIEISRLQINNLSFEDCSVWFLAKKLNGILLTGDANLRKSALKAGLDVRGIFFIFDKLVEENIIDTIEAIEKLRKLRIVNTRLPISEIEKRIKLWNNE